MMPPKPRPVRKRRTISCGSVCAAAVASMPEANIKVQDSNTGRRPTRSDKAPNSSAPSSKPNSPAANTGPSADLAMPQSSSRAGAT